RDRNEEGPGVDREMGPDRVRAPEHAWADESDQGDPQPHENSRADDRAGHGSGTTRKSASTNREDHKADQKAHQQTGTDHQRQGDQRPAGNVHEYAIAVFRLRSAVSKRLG